MLAIETLKTSLSTDTLYPQNAAFMPRACASQMRFLGVPLSTQDTVTSILMGAFNNRPTIRHQGGATPEILSLIRRSGIVVDEDMRLYETLAEADQHAHDVTNEGYKLVWPYPPEEKRFPADANLVSVPLWKKLNAKENLQDLVPKRNLARRYIYDLKEAAAVRFDGPVYVKAAGDAPTASGFAVRYCQTEHDLIGSLEFFQSLKSVDRLIFEEAIDVVGTWCVTIAISDTGTFYAGAAEQTFTSPAKQTGNIIDVERPFPAHGIEAAIATGEAARALGYRGLAGLDVGISHDGRAIVFDPNFRSQASTMQVLLHTTATERVGATINRSFNMKSNSSVKDLTHTLERAIDDGWFVAMRIIDGERMPSINAHATVTGMVLGRSHREVNKRWDELKTRIDAQA